MHCCLQMQALLLIPWSRIRSHGQAAKLPLESISKKAACAISLEPQELPTRREPRGISCGNERTQPMPCIPSAHQGTEGPKEFQPQDPGVSCITCIGA